MISFTDFLALIGFFAVRVGVPLATTVGLVYLLKRLDRRWEVEARAQQSAEVAEQPAIQPAAPKSAERPVQPVRAPAPGPQIPWVPPLPRTDIRPQIQPGLAATSVSRPCWDEKSCNEAMKAQCAAPSHPNLPCWQARFDAEGQIPESCVNCERFQRYPLM